MGDEMFYPPSLFSFVYGPVFTYLCFFSHQYNASESNFKENLGIQDILIHQKASNLVHSLLTYATRVNVWDNMATLQWWFYQQQCDWSDISEWLTCRNCELKIRWTCFHVAILIDWLVRVLRCIGNICWRLLTIVVQLFWGLFYIYMHVTWCILYKEAVRNPIHDIFTYFIQIYNTQDSIKSSTFNNFE